MSRYGTTWSRPLLDSHSDPSQVTRHNGPPAHLRSRELHLRKGTVKVYRKIGLLTALQGPFRLDLATERHANRRETRSGLSCVQGKPSFPQEGLECLDGKLPFPTLAQDFLAARHSKDRAVPAIIGHDSWPTLHTKKNTRRTQN